MRNPPTAPSQLLGIVRPPPGAARESSRSRAEPALVDEWRLWVPGLVYTTAAGDLRIGPTRGYLSRDGSFADLRCGFASRVTDWTHVAWVVARSDLRAESLEELGVVLPESLVDVASQPHAHRWLREQSLVAVSGATRDRFAAADVPLYRIAFDVAGDQRLQVEVTRGAKLIAAVDGTEEALRIAVVHASEGRALIDVQGDPSPIDRLLRVVSRGAVTEESLVCAVDARRVVEDGYGYRGAREGRFRGIDEVAHDLAPLDVLFGPVFARGAATLRDAQLVVRRLEASSQVEKEVSMRDAVARPIAVPELRWPRGQKLVLAGREGDGLVLPAETRWSLTPSH